MLYHLVGELWISGNVTQSDTRRLSRLLKKVDSHSPTEIQTWATRVDALVLGHIEFDGQLWLHFIVTGQEEYRAQQENE